jgi:23S rRNA pseudouridine2605 synthase
VSTLIRLNKLLSAHGVASRRAADTLIQQGRVELNGHVVTELGTKADPDRDDIRVDGRRLKTAPVKRYLLMNKPVGVMSTRSDPQRRTTVVDLIAKAGFTGYFYPVGRLDYDSEGLIILTNDGAFAERVSHPRYELERTYEAVVEGVPDERDLERLRRGVPVEGQRTQPATVHLRRVVESKRGQQSVLEIVIHEGRNRQIRRMADAIAHPVARLKRVRIGHVTDASLRPGDFRELTPGEIRDLMKGAPRGPADAATRDARRQPDAGSPRPVTRQARRQRGPERPRRG